jgi:hypothetical protein
MNGMFEESVSYFKKVVEINPKDEIAYSNLIRSLIYLNQFD